MPSEWFYVIKPELDRLRITNTEIKIHVSDSNSTDISLLKSEDREDSLTINSGLLNFGSTRRWRYIREYMEKIGKGIRVGLIVGLDKIIPYSQNGEYGFVFSDNSVFTKGNSFDHENHNIEFFYWTEDFPQIVIEQSHTVWDYLNNNVEFTRTRMNNMIAGLWTDREKVFDNIIKQICYPYWDFSKHQVNKSLPFNNGGWSYVNNFSSERFFQNSHNYLMSHIALLDKQIALDDRYKGLIELKPFYNYHSIGKLPNLNQLHT
jgi:hypothetical protein